MPCKALVALGETSALPTAPYSLLKPIPVLPSVFRVGKGTFHVELCHCCMLWVVNS